jgi:hypothetical protein
MEFLRVGSQGSKQFHGGLAFMLCWEIDPYCCVINEIDKQDAGWV